MDGLEQKVISLTERLKHLEEEYYHNKTEMKEEIKELTQVQIETNKQLALLNVTVQSNVEATKECTKHMKEQLNKPNEFVASTLLCTVTFNNASCLFVSICTCVSSLISSFISVLL